MEATETSSSARTWCPGVNSLPFADLWNRDFRIGFRRASSVFGVDAAVFWVSGLRYKSSVLRVDSLYFGLSLLLQIEIHFQIWAFNANCTIIFDIDLILELPLG